MPLTFDGVSVVVDRFRVSGSQPWTTYVRARVADVVGWYGPVSAQSAHGACYLASTANGLDGRDHVATLLSLRRSCSTEYDLAALGTLDALLWDVDAKLQASDLASALGATDETREAPGYASLLPIDLRRADACELIACHLDDTVELAKFGIRVEHCRDERELRASWAQQARRTARMLPASAFDFRGVLDESAAIVVAAAPQAEDAVWLEDLMVPYDGSAYQRVAAAAPGTSLGIGEYLYDGTFDLPAWIGMLDTRPTLTIDPISCGGITLALQLLDSAARIGCDVYLHGRHLRVAAAIAMARPAQVRRVEIQLIWELDRLALHRHPLSATATSVQRSSCNGIGAEPPNG